MAEAKLSFRPVAAEAKADFVAVFEGPGGPKYCWCMAWRATKEELKNTKSPARRQQMLRRIDGGVPVGLVGYLEDEPGSWSVAPPPEPRCNGSPWGQHGRSARQFRPPFDGCPAVGER